MTYHCTLYAARLDSINLLPNRHFRFSNSFSLPGIWRKSKNIIITYDNIRADTILHLSFRVNSMQLNTKQYKLNAN